MSLESELKVREFAQKRPFDYEINMVGKTPLDAMAIDVGVGSLIGSYIISTGGREYDSLSHIPLQIGIILLTSYLSLRGGELIGSYIRQKNIQRNEDSQ